MNAVSMGNATFQGLSAPEPLNRFSKHFAQLITSVTPPHTQIFRSVGPKGACLHMREIVIVRHLFFRVFLVSCASLQVRPFDLQMATSKRHNSGTVKDTCKMFAPNWGFWGSGNQMVLFKFLLDPPSLPWQQADVIWTQNRPLLSLSRLVR